VRVLMGTPVDAAHGSERALSQMIRVLREISTAVK
jgi:hypothetical protein